MGSGDSSSTENLAVFNQTISQACKSNASSTASNTGNVISGNSGCEINISAQADSYAECSLDAISQAVSQAAAEAASTATSDFLPSVSVSEAKNSTIVKQTLESECTAESYAEAINANNQILNNSSAWNAPCVVNLTALAPSISTCAITTAAAAFSEQDAASSASSETTALGTFMTGLTDIVGSVAGAYAVIVVVIVIVIGLVIGGFVLFMNNNPDVVNNAVNKASSAVGPAAMLGGNILGSDSISSSLSMGAEYFNQTTSAISSTFM